MAVNLKLRSKRALFGMTQKDMSDLLGLKADGSYYAPQLYNIYNGIVNMLKIYIDYVSGSVEEARAVLFC